MLRTGNQQVRDPALRDIRCQDLTTYETRFETRVK